MAVSLAEEAISLLLDMAEQGEIDPWDVEVIDVVDRFLSRLSPAANTHDLSESGQAFLYAAMLVYLKAMALTDPTVDEPDPEPETLSLFEDPLETWSPKRLDKVLKPRPVPRLNRTRPVTLKELIQHLQDLEGILQNRPEKPPTAPKKRLSRQKAMAAITELAHPENLLETTAELESLLAQLWQRGLQNLSFERLVEHYQGAAFQPEMTANSHGSVQPHRIQVFWSLLLMASRSQVDLRQEEFYQDLTVLPCHRESDTTVPEPA